MTLRRNTGAPARASRTLVVLLAALACLGAAAYAANRPERSGGTGKEAGALAAAGGKLRKAAPKLPRPQILSGPAAVDTSASVRFDFRAANRKLRFQCRLDGSAWKPCRSPHVAHGIAAGPHEFAVRAVGKPRRGRPARHTWTRVEPRPLTVQPQADALRPLYPGAPTQTIPVRIFNPNAVAVTLTSLTVTVSEDPPGCPADPNFELVPASLSSAAPVIVPAGGEIVLPTPSVAAPGIGLRELPFNQDACRGASLPLRFDAEAQG